MEVKKYNTM